MKVLCLFTVKQRNKVGITEIRRDSLVIEVSSHEEIQLGLECALQMESKSRGHRPFHRPFEVRLTQYLPEHGEPYFDESTGGSQCHETPAVH